MEKKTALRTGCLLMAAGNASRFNANKLMADFRGKPLIRYAMEAIAQYGFDQIVVVTQYPQIEAMAGEFGFDCIRNEYPEWGASYTIRLGTQALQDCDGVLYMVSDQPQLTAESVRHIVETWKQTPDCVIAPASGERTGNPCIFPQKLFAALMALEGDVGGKKVIRQHPELLRTVQIEAEQLFDCDTPEALEELRKQKK